MLGTALALGRVITRFVSRKPPGSTQTRTASHVIENNSSPSLLPSLQLRRFFPSSAFFCLPFFNALLPCPVPFLLRPFQPLVAIVASNQKSLFPPFFLSLLSSLLLSINSFPLDEYGIRKRWIRWNFVTSTYVKRVSDYQIDRPRIIPGLVDCFKRVGSLP